MGRKSASRPADSVLVPRQILVGVDFGTTYSGVAWAQTARPDVQTAIVQWPDTEGSLEGQTSEKVPTQICYMDNSCVWGFGIPDDEPRHQWFKLALDPSHCNDCTSLLAIDFPDPKALPPGYNRKLDAVKLTIDYLGLLHSHTLEILRLKLGDSVVNTTPINYTITVPAIWSDAAKVQTQRCASAAGMGDEIQIVSEPEAAVIYALDSIDPHNLRVGENFILCDAGGGTVDLITYNIVSLDPIVKVREAVPGSGDACGSTFLNRIFRKYLEDSLGDLDGFGDDTLEDAMEEFETTTKRRFIGTEESVLIRVPGLADNVEKGVRRQKLTIKGAVLRDLFKPVMGAITTLVKCQLQHSKKARAIILVGGFGQSPYLRRCIQQVVGDEIEIMQPAYGWSAVVRGALLKALHDTSPEHSRVDISSRRARRAYGVKLCDSYNPHLHHGRQKYWNSYSGTYKVSAMDWFVDKVPKLRGFFERECEANKV